MIRTTRPPVRIGIAGLGRAGLEMHCSELLQLPELFKIVAVCDPSKERRDIAFEKLPDCRSYRRYEDLLADPEVELVDIATRSDEHAMHIVQALKTRKWVQVERPFCIDYEQAMMLRAVAIKSGNRLMVRHNYRFEPAFLQVKEVIEEGKLGEVYSIKMRRGKFERRDDWQTIKRCGGGATLTWGTAFIDQALELLKTPPDKLWADLKRIAAVGDAEDYMHVIMRNVAGHTVDLEISGGRVTPAPLFTVSGTKGEYVVAPDGQTGKLRYLDPKHKLSRRRSSVRTPPLGSFGKPETLHWKEEESAIAPKAASGLTLIWEHVFNTIRENKPFPIALDSAIEVMRHISFIKKNSIFG